MKKIFILSLVVAASAFTILAQNRFEGHNIILDAPTSQKATACAIRFAPASTAALVTDLDRSTPMKVTACDGSSNVTQNTSGSASVRTNASDHKWCFQGEDKMYRITYPGDQFSGPIIYNWIAIPPPTQAGFYNVRDFGAVGDGTTDDTIEKRVTSPCDDPRCQR